MAASSFAMSVSVPGTIVIFTQMSGFAWLNMSTIVCIQPESGGVCCVQKSTWVAPSAHATAADGWARLGAGATVGEGDSSCALATLASPLAVSARAPTAAKTSHREMRERELMVLLLWRDWSRSPLDPSFRAWHPDSKTTGGPAAHA